MKTETIFIGTRCITKPNFFGKIIKETPKTITIEIINLDFTPKTGSTGMFTHKFDANSRAWLKGIFKGQIRKFWKETGLEIANDFSFIPNHAILFD